MDRTTKIKLLSIITLIGFSVAVFYHYVMGAYLNHDFPLNTFLFTPNDKFNDFFNFTRPDRILKPYNTYTWNVIYPFALLLIYFFEFLSGGGKFALFAYVGTFLFFWMFFTIKNFSQPYRLDNIRDLFIISFLSYPFLITLDRANPELYCFLFLCGFVFFYKSTRAYKSMLALISLSFAIAMKPFPAIFIILLADEKRWKSILGVILFTLLIIFLSFLCFEGSIIENINGLMSNQKQYIQSYWIHNAGWAYGISLFGLLKLIIGIIAYYSSPDQFINLVSMSVKPYSLFSLLVIGLITLYIITKEKIIWKKLALIVFMMNALPHISGDYKLLNLFIPLAFFVNEVRKSKYDLIYVILFGLLIIPKNYFVIPKLTSLGLSMGIILNPLLMLALAILIIKEGLSQTKTQSIIQ